MKKTAASLWEYKLYFLAAVIVLLYVLRLDADGIAGLFGVFLADEGPYLLAAKNQVLFGAAHFFEGDRYRPELITPLLHHYALLAISPAEPIWAVRFGMALLVLSGMGLMSWLAGRYHQNAADALACFLCLLLNPILFFYARAGLSEGMQFFLLALILVLLFRLHRSERVREAAWLACGIGMLTGVLFLAKVGAIGICLGCGTGLLAALYGNPSLIRKPLLAGLSLLSVLTVLFLYLSALGPQLPGWMDANFAHAWNQLPENTEGALQRALFKLPHLAYFLALMPVFALYLPSLLIAAGKKQAFAFVLCIIALTVIAAEFMITGSADSTGSIRRNFFGLAMLSIVAGFTCREYLQKGISFSFRRDPIKILSAVFIIVYLSGAIFLLRWALQQSDLPYIVFCALFLLIALLALVSASGARPAGPRRMLMTLAALSSLVPILFQAFLTPRTREEIAAAIEEIMPEDAFLIGSTAPWYLQGLRRKIIFNNCMDGFSDIDYANPIDTVPPEGKIYFLGLVPIKEDVCAPKDADRYRFITQFRLFIPENYGGLYGVSDNWGYSRIFYLYEKI